MGWRDQIPIHPAAELFPLMSESELRELGEDIKKNGQKVQIVFFSADGPDRPAILIDGRNRLDAMELVGLPISDEDGHPAFNIRFMEGDPYDLVLSLNINRRHLTEELRRELIAKVIKAKPEESDRSIAKKVKRDHKTVAKVRKKLESTGEVSPVQKRTGADGKKRKSPQKKKAREALNAIADGKMGDSCLMAERASGSAEVSIERRQAQNAALDMPTEEEADESWQNDLYDQACLLLERMADATRQRFIAHLVTAGGGDIVEQYLSFIAAMTKDQRAQFFAKYTELSAAKAPPRPKAPPMRPTKSRGGPE